MSTEINISEQISMAIDLKKHRLRVHKQTLRLLGSPPYVQLLFSTKMEAIVILARKTAVPGGQEIKVVFDKNSNAGTFDIYSKELISRIQEQYAGLNDRVLYRLIGYELKEESGVCFPLSTLIRTEEPHVP